MNVVLPEPAMPMQRITVGLCSPEAAVFGALELDAAVAEVSFKSAGFILAGICVCARR